jgi:hypothetical protein
LLQSCSTIHSALVPSNNPRLYAKLFRNAFDTKAAKRRCAEAGGAAGEGVTHAKGLTAELERRVRVMRSLKGRVGRNDVRGMGTEEGWVIYLMMVENGTSGWYICRGNGRVKCRCDAAM